MAGFSNFEGQDTAGEFERALPAGFASGAGGMGTEDITGGAALILAERSISWDELDARVMDEPKGFSPENSPGVRRITESHREVARLLAQGLRPVEVSAVTGYSQSRISVLKQFPAFQELLHLYSSQRDRAFADVIQQMKTLSLDVVQEISRRLDEAPDELSVKDLAEVLKLTLDRTGHGPSQTIKREDSRLDPETLQKLRRVLSEREAEVIEIAPSNLEPALGRSDQ